MMRRILRSAWLAWRWSRAAVEQPLLRAWVRIWGATVHPSVKFAGRPVVRVAKGSQLVLGAGVVVHSAIYANPVIGRRTTTLCTMAPGARLELARNVGLSGVCICAAREIRIGEGTIIGADAMVLDNDFHVPLPDWRWGDAAAEAARPVHVGRGCFVGARAMILKGVTIGDGAVVGAGAVVTSDVPPEHLAFGNPAQVRPLPPKWRRSAD